MQVHPEYDPEDTTSSYDIALLRLTTASAAQPIRLPRNTREPGASTAAAAALPGACTHLARD